MAEYAPLIGITLAVLYRLHWWYIGKRWHRTTGEVVRHERNDSEEVGPGTAVLLYADESGQTHTVRSTWGGVGGLLRGETAPVYYSPKNPARAQVGGLMNEYGIPAVLILFSFVVWLFGQ